MQIKFPITKEQLDLMHQEYGNDEYFRIIELDNEERDNKALWRRCNQIVPSRDFDDLNYNLYLKYALIEELENDTIVPDTYKKMGKEMFK